MPALVDALSRPVRRYAEWLHLRWPAGRVEPLPEIREDGRTNVPGLRIVGDLTGIPLLKLASDSGAGAVRAILAESGFTAERARRAAGTLDLLIVGAGVSGMAAALEARAAGLDVAVVEANRRFHTVADFPKAKPIFTYPRAIAPRGRLRVTSDVKEGLLAELREQTHEVPVRPGRVTALQRRGGVLVAALDGGGELRALRAIVAIGRSGNFRKLGVPGEELDKVFDRLHDPADFAGRNVLVVGGGDGALEAATALARAGARVTLVHRGRELVRPKRENLERFAALVAGGSDGVRIDARMETEVAEIAPAEVVLRGRDGKLARLANDVVFKGIGREAPLDFFRRSGVRIAGEKSAARLAALALSILFCLWLYHWKAPYAIPFGLELPAWLSPAPGAWVAAPADPASVAGTLRISASSPAFYYALAYSAAVVAFGVRRIRARRTPYVRRQTLTLMAIQVLPLFLLPELLLPWLGHNGALDGGWLGALADALFPASALEPHGREYWRAYGLVLAWPLFVWNAFTEQPLAAWLAIGFVQTFVLIPAMIYVWGKGAYCGWICSCGALAETLGDRHRHKMPHGPGWNRLNLLGQAILALALALLALRVAGWIAGSESAPARLFRALHQGIPLLNYSWLVDLVLAGVLGYGLYFWFSGRMWCRFACPLAALMHVYARFSRFRILADKKKCISCNACTAICHQGIDVMSFANKGLPMSDPQCVRCSACVHACPTGVLAFGQVDRAGNVIALDALGASAFDTARRARARSETS